jgi:uncharacterized membrane protein
VNKSDMPASTAAYLDRVAQLLSDVDEEERVSLLADLEDELREIPESELAERLGMPEDFAAEYRRSAGIKVPDNEEPEIQSKIATVVSVLALPFGVLLLFSFGGQLIYGPFVLAIEWILARISPRPLRLAWAFLGAALVGEIVYLVLDIHVRRIDGFLAVVVALAAAASVALLFFRTTDER